MFTRGLMTTPLPTRAPNRRSTLRFNDEGNGNGVRNKAHLTRYQRASTSLGRPRSKPWRESNRSRRTRVLAVLGTSSGKILDDGGPDIAGFHQPTTIQAALLP